MTKFKPLPTQQELQEHFQYSVVTGEMIWIKSRNPRVPAGARAGTPDTYGHFKCTFKGASYPVHRLVWKLITGEDPSSKEVEHINRDPQNNAWHNLRLATHKENMRNIQRKGVSFLNNPKLTKQWMARIQVDGKRIFVGTFLTEEEAVQAYQQAKNKAHGAFSPYSDE